MATQTDRFIREVLPLADAAASALHIPVSVVLAQWINETGAGSSRFWSKYNNPAGISYLDGPMKAAGGRKIANTAVLAFPSRQHGVLAYIVRWRRSPYDATRARWKANPDPIRVAEAIQDSPWAGGHYDHHGLVDLIREHRLEQYDGGQASPPPGPTPAPDSGGGGASTPCAGLRPGPAPQGHRTLRVGMHGQDVAELQQLLAQHGYRPNNSIRANGHGDGMFGPHTAEAVARFQEAHGLHPDGIVGRQVYCALGVR